MDGYHSYQKQDDCGPYFVYEQGQLRNSSGFSVERITSRLFKEVPEANPFCQARLVVDENGCIQLPTLKTLCLTFIAQNIHLVDTLEDFPEIIGEELFRTAAEVGVFHKLTSHGAMEALRLFCQAYGPAVIDGVSSRGNAVRGLELCMSGLLNLQQITSVDLCGCLLGEDHPLLSNLGRMSGLVVLGLEATGLTDTGLRRLTSPVRILRQGPVSLSTVQLARNTGITDKGLGFLLCFSQLHLVDLTGTSVTESGIAMLVKRTGLKLSREPVEVFQYVCSPSGWGADVVRKWLTSSVDQERSAACQTKTETSAGPLTSGSFYGRRITRKTQTSSFKQLSVHNRRLPEQVSHKDTPYLHLTKVSTNNQPAWHKRKLCLMSTDSEHQQLTSLSLACDSLVKVTANKKRKCVSSDRMDEMSEEDQAILLSYSAH